MMWITRFPIVGGTAVNTLDRIEKLLKASPIIEPSEAVKLRAAQRAIDKKAPFHRDKNAMADAIIIETYAECVRDKNSVREFALPLSRTTKATSASRMAITKMPHPDFAGLFSRIKSLYFINLPEALRRVEPSLVTDIMLEQSWTQEPRGLTEILEAEDLLFHQVWYNRHWNLRIGVEEGRIKVVDKETYPRRLVHRKRSSGTCGKAHYKPLGESSVATARRTWDRGMISSGA